MVKAVVFDAGETLINEGRLWRLWAEWLGVPDHVLFAVLGGVIERGEHHHRVFELLRPGFKIEQAREERLRCGAPDIVEAGDLYPDVEPSLRALHSRGFKIGIAANQPAVFESVMSRVGLPVDFIASSERWQVEKPSPAFFQKIVDEAGMPADSIAYVGDRVDNDILPARAAGMLAVFIRRGPWGFIHAKRPEAAQADLRIESLLELENLYVKSFK
jgi:HAD superfamily hydrolase (TIGR01662 family)